MVQFFPVSICLRIEAECRLHAHQCATLYALISRANGLGLGKAPHMPDGLLLHAPEQGRMFYRPNERFVWGVTLLAANEAQAADCLRPVLRGLEAIARDHPPVRKGLSGNFALEKVVSIPSQQEWPRPYPAGGLTPIPRELLADECERVAALRELTLRMISPLRCERPNPLQRDGQRYMNDGLFLPDVFVSRAAGRLHKLGILETLPPIDPQALHLLDSRLTYLDVSYGPQAHRKALGGVVGRVRLRLKNPELAPILALAQYVRVGEKTRFGFGEFRIEELGMPPHRIQRSVGLLQLALRDEALHEAAHREDLTVGELVHQRRRLEQGTYEPRPPTRLLLAGDGPEATPRLLSIPHPVDRALQSAVLRQIAPPLDLFFEESSLAYRKGLGRQRAARRLQECYRQGYRWAVRSDFHRFFDSIDHSLLRDRLSAYLADDELERLILAWVASGSIQPGRGLPTGSPLSPLLSNLFLDHFDEQIAREGGRLVRYADDFLILLPSQAEAARLLDQARRVAQELKLRLNERKTSLLDLRQPFDFLGFRFERRDTWQIAADQSVQLLDDLGWQPLPKRPPDVAWPRLSGETESPAAFSTILIVGPGVDWVGLKNHQLVCTYRQPRRTQSFPLQRISDLVILGPATLDHSLFHNLRDDPLEIWLADRSGRLRSVLLNETPLDNAALLAAQVAAAADPARRLLIARGLVAAKIANYSRLAAAVACRPRYPSVTTQLEELSDQAAAAGSLDELLGFEGAAAAAWYRSFAGRIGTKFRFARRIAPQATDPVNVLLNLGFSWLHRLAELLAVQQQLAPSVGFLHAPRPGHMALASDLMEPFRHLVDRAVIVATQQLRPGDFRATPRGRYELEIAPHAARSFIAWLNQSWTEHCTAAHQSEPRPYRLQLAALARTLHRHLLDPAAPWQVFRHPRFAPREKD